MDFKFEDFEQFRPELTRIARLLTRLRTGADWLFDYDLADDVVQDTYLKYHSMLLKGTVTIDNKGHLEAILKKMIWQTSRRAIATNKGVRYRCKEDRIDMDLLPEAFHPSTLGYRMSRAEINYIYDAIHSLQYKSDIGPILLVIEGYTVPEIVEIERRTSGAIRTSLFRARRELRTKLNVEKYMATGTIRTKKQK